MTLKCRSGICPIPSQGDPSHCGAGYLLLAARYPGTKCLIVALLGGVLTLMLINFRHFHHLGRAVNDGTTGALVAIGNTSAVVGFGAVAKSSAAFATAVEVMTNMPGNELLGLRWR